MRGDQRLERGRRPARSRALTFVIALGLAGSARGSRRSARPAHSGIGARPSRRRARARAPTVPDSTSARRAHPLLVRPDGARPPRVQPLVQGSDRDLPRDRRARALGEGGAGHRLRRAQGPGDSRHPAGRGPVRLAQRPARAGPRARRARAARPRCGSFSTTSGGPSATTRKSAISPRERDELGLALARVVAHEVVHAIVPDEPHAASGLMHHSMDRRFLLGVRAPIDEGCARGLPTDPLRAALSGRRAAVARTREDRAPAP